MHRQKANFSAKLEKYLQVTNMAEKISRIRSKGLEFPTNIKAMLSYHGGYNYTSSM